MVYQQSVLFQLYTIFVEDREIKLRKARFVSMTIKDRIHFISFATDMKLYLNINRLNLTRANYNLSALCFGIPNQ